MPPERGEINKTYTALTQKMHLTIMLGLVMPSPSHNRFQHPAPESRNTLFVMFVNYIIGHNAIPDVHKCLSLVLVHSTNKNKSCVTESCSRYMTDSQVSWAQGIDRCSTELASILANVEIIKNK